MAPAGSLTWPAQRVPFDPAWARIAGVGLSIVGAGALAWSVSQFGLAPVLAALPFAISPLLLLMWPRAATMLVVLLLYVNFPAILTKQHGVPAMAAGAFVALLAFPLARAWVIRREALRTDTTFGLMLVMLGVLLLSSILALDRTIAFERIQAYVLEGLLLYWLILNAIRDVPTLRRVVWTMVAAGALVSTLCLYQEVTGSYANEFGGLAYRNYAPIEDAGGGEVIRRRTWDRAQGPVDDPNRFAQITIVLLPLAMFLYRRSRTRAQRLAAAVSGALILAGVGLTLSRGAFLSLAVLALAMMAVRWLRPFRVLVAVVVLIGALSTISPFFIDRLSSLTNALTVLSGDAGSQAVDGATRRRTTEMLAALHVFRDYPISGVGPGQFSPFYVEEYSRNPDIKFNEVRGPRRAHTLYLEIAAETGVLGLTVFLAIVGFTLKHLYRRRLEWADEDAERSDFATAFVLSLGVFLVTAIFLHMAFQQYFWLLLACCGAAVYVLRPPVERTRVWLR